MGGAVVAVGEVLCVLFDEEPGVRVHPDQGELQPHAVLLDGLGKGLGVAGVVPGYRIGVGVFVFTAQLFPLHGEQASSRP